MLFRDWTKSLYIMMHDGPRLCESGFTALIDCTFWIMIWGTSMRQVFLACPVTATIITTYRAMTAIRYNAYAKGKLCIHFNQSLQASHAYLRLVFGGVTKLYQDINVLIQDTLLSTFQWITNMNNQAHIPDIYGIWPLSHMIRVQETARSSEWQAQYRAVFRPMDHHAVGPPHRPRGKPSNTSRPPLSS
jgi:hypothetical protein